MGHIPARPAPHQARQPETQPRRAQPPRVPKNAVLHPRIVPPMSCHGNNATAPSPAIAPAGPLSPSAHDHDPRRIAEAIRRQHDGHAIDPRVLKLIPPSSHHPGFDAPFYQAGLAGYSDAAMRIVARRHGCPICVTEALLDRTLLAGGRGFAKADLGPLHDNVPGGEEDAPLVGQIMGSDPAEMAAAALKMIEQGERKPSDYRKMAYQGSEISHPGSAEPSPSPSPSPTSFAAIDVNLACPVKKIASKARGGHWLADPAGAVRILEAVREAVSPAIPVTVKMRRAFDDTPEMAESFETLLTAAHDVGCAWVTVHARTVQQKYIGPSRWDLLRDIRQRHPNQLIFGSGDVWTAADVFRMIAYTGVTGVSVARGCIGNPWLFRQCRQILAGDAPTAPTLAEQRDVLEQHFALALRVNQTLIGATDDEARARRGELHTGKTMRKFGIRFAAHHPEPEAVKQRMIAVTNLEDWRQVLEDCYVPTEESFTLRSPAPGGGAVGNAD
ncbi:MAG: tRNA-dihydrouridine synthase family protein [Phycisphaerales bacterium]|nr:MAG: tRNA-dihydrouridine synthase family protein [Phycisphaerales bacterium]